MNLIIVKKLSKMTEKNDDNHYKDYNAYIDLLII